MRNKILSQYLVPLNIMKIQRRYRWKCSRRRCPTIKQQQQLTAGQRRCIEISLVIVVLLVVLLPSTLMITLRHHSTTQDSPTPSFFNTPPPRNATFFNDSFTYLLAYDSTDSPTDQTLHRGLLTTGVTLSLNAVGGDMSIEVVFKPSSPTSSVNQTLFSLGPSSPILFYVDTMSVALPNSWVKTTSNLLANTWQHLVVTLSTSGTIMIYQQGTCVGIAYNQGGGPDVVARLSSCVGCFPGLIDEFNIYSVVLTGAEIRTLYRNAMIPTTPPTATIQSYDPTGTFWWRPLLHYTTRLNFMNDPNGLIYDPSTKLWHLFSQYRSTYNQVNGVNDLNWGHAVSYDLVNWDEYGLAIPQINGVSAFSGTSVFDYTNSSGLCNHCMIAVYSGDVGGGSGTEDVRLAYTTDAETFTQYALNPVINPGESNFRDPSVARYSGESGSISGSSETSLGIWVAAVFSNNNAINFYHSANLLSWTLVSQYTNIAGECPNWFPMTVVETGLTVWVLKISYGAEAASWYQVGTFDGTIFTSYTPNQHYSWDQGPDFYSDQTFANALNNRRVMTAWMAPRGYSYQTTSPWQSQYSIPRDLTAHQYHATGSGTVMYIVQGLPVTEMATYRTQTLSFVNGTNIGSVYEIYGVFPITTSTTYTLYIRCTPTFSEYVSVSLHGTSVTVDRSHLGLTGQSYSDYYTPYIITPPSVQEVTTSISLRVLVDKSSLEVFLQDGLASASFLIFPTPNINNTHIYMKGGTTNAMTIWSYE